MHTGTKHSTLFAILIGCFFLLCCQGPATIPPLPETQTAKPDTTIFTPYSTHENSYEGFHSPIAINTLAKMENAYFRNYARQGSPYYGTVWRGYAEGAVPPQGGASLYSRFVDTTVAHGSQPDSMHCTIYAVRALKAGLGYNWNRLEAAHREIWKDREHAGWSIGYLLVRDFGWKAWLVIDRESTEFTTCERAWKSSKTYPVWKQPDIALEGFLVKGEQDSLIQNLLLANEFGWGFSHQGIHTWITRFGTLKECNWGGAPAKQFEHPNLLMQDELFIETPFLEFDRFASHVIVFPPRMVLSARAQILD